MKSSDETGIRGDDSNFHQKTFRTLLFTGIFLFFISSAILVLASLHKLPFLSVTGPIDFIIAFLIFAISIRMHMKFASLIKTGEIIMPYKVFMKCFQSLSIAAGVIIALIWLLRNQLDMNIFLPGLAWRTFILIYTIPFAVIGRRKLIS